MKTKTTINGELVLPLSSISSENVRLMYSTVSFRFDCLRIIYRGRAYDCPLFYKMVFDEPLEHVIEFQGVLYYVDLHYYI